MKKETDKIQEVYQFQNLSKYSFIQRIAIRLIGMILYVLVAIIGKTIRFEIEGAEYLDEIEKDGKLPIYGFWHDRIFLGTYYFRHRGIVVMSSQSYDSEYVARFIQRFGYGIVKGSSTRGGVGGLVGMIRVMRDGLPTGFTLDGPKGPRYIAKPGAVLLAKKTQNPLLPFIVEAKKFWQIGSWDQLHIPKPFSRAKVFISDPIYIFPDSDEKELENKRLELQNALDELVKRGVQWRESDI
jgi:lysophospholipid acyltransferase (LPLAT)-like uncharacterized protein